MRSTLRGGSHVALTTWQRMGRRDRQGALTNRIASPEEHAFTNNQSRHPVLRRGRALSQWKRGMPSNEGRVIVTGLDRMSSAQTGWCLCRRKFCFASFFFLPPLLSFELPFRVSSEIKKWYRREIRQAVEKRDSLNWNRLQRRDGSRDERLVAKLTPPIYYNLRGCRCGGGGLVEGALSEKEKNHGEPGHGRPDSPDQQTSGRFQLHWTEL